jgi:hypothetical protein
MKIFNRQNVIMFNFAGRSTASKMDLSTLFLESPTNAQDAHYLLVIYKIKFFYYKLIKVILNA